MSSNKGFFFKFRKFTKNDYNVWITKKICMRNLPLFFSKYYHLLLATKFRKIKFKFKQHLLIFAISFSFISFWKRKTTYISEMVHFRIMFIFFFRSQNIETIFLKPCIPYPMLFKIFVWKYRFDWSKHRRLW